MSFRSNHQLGNKENEVKLEKKQNTSFGTFSNSEATTENPHSSSFQNTSTFKDSQVDDLSAEDLSDHTDDDEPQQYVGQQQFANWDPRSWTPRKRYLFYTILGCSSSALLGVIIWRIVVFAEYMHQKKNCENENKQFVYMPDFAEDECTVCGEDELVYYGDVFASQGCLDGLFAEERLPKEILFYLQQILKHPDFSRLDLSKQNWKNWSVTDWQYLLNNVSSVTSHLATLNLSYEILNPVLPTDGHIEALNAFFNKVTIDRLDIRSQGIGDRLFEKLFAGLETKINNTLKYLDISSNQLTDGVAGNLSQLLLNSRKTLHTLISEYNRFSDVGIQRIIPALVNSSVTTFNVKGNAFGKDGLTAISNIVANPAVKLEVVDVSVNDLSLADTKQFGQAVAASQSVTEVNLRKTNIDDEAARLFMVSVQQAGRVRLRSVDLSSNPLTDIGMQMIIYHVTSTRDITAIYFNENTLTDYGMYNLVGLFNLTWLKKIGLARIGSFTAQGLKALLANAPRTLESLDLQGNNLGDSIVEAFNGTSSVGQLKKINLAANQLTDKAGMSLVRLFANVTDLNLRFNYLTDLTMQALAEVFPGNFVTLEMDNNNIQNATGIINLARKLPGSRLQKLSLSYNVLGDESALAIAEQLVTPTPTRDELSGEALSGDEARAIRQTKPATNLTELDLSNNEINVAGARGVCRVLANTNIKRKNFSFDGNSASDNFHNCEKIYSKKHKSAQPHFFNKRAEHIVAKRHARTEKFSEVNDNYFPALRGGDSSRHASTLFNLSMLSEMLLGMVALYLVYSALRPILNSVWEKGSTLFARDDTKRTSVNERKPGSPRFGNV